MPREYASLRPANVSRQICVQHCSIAGFVSDYIFAAFKRATRPRKRIRIWQNTRCPNLNPAGESGMLFELLRVRDPLHDVAPSDDRRLTRLLPLLHRDPSPPTFLSLPFQSPPPII